MVAGSVVDMPPLQIRRLQHMLQQLELLSRRDLPRRQSFEKSVIDVQDLKSVEDVVPVQQRRTIDACAQTALANKTFTGDMEPEC